MTPRGAYAWIEGLEVLGMRFGLERMRALLEALGHPERGWPSVHVVGSNGKSSTARLAAAALRGEGHRVGTYLSPHVTTWRERIEVGGRAVAAADFARAVSVVRAAAEGLGRPSDDGVTQFEALTAAAMWIFTRAGCDAAVIEAGLGGRYDATNVLPAGPTVVALTNISLEHTDLLGDTEAAIAAEKLAVAPPGSDRVVVGRLSATARAAVEAEVRARRLRAWWTADRVSHSRGGGLAVTTPLARYEGLVLPLAGAFQRDNLAVALAAAERVSGHPLDPAALRRALSGVRMPGRLEALPGRPLIVLDGAHNPAGMEAMAAALPEVVGRRRPVAVVSALGDKDLAAMVRALAGACRAVVATRSSHPRAVDPRTIVRLAEAEGISAAAVEPPLRAVERARRRAGARGAVLVCGSLYLLADLRRRLLREAPFSPATLAPAADRRAQDEEA
jgi:dihydrofolate synthase / folylpolyglutamate synthase